MEEERVVGTEEVTRVAPHLDYHIIHAISYSRDIMSSMLCTMYDEN